MSLTEKRMRRHSPWFALVAAFTVVLGLLMPTASAEAASYIAPSELKAVNSLTKASIELSWRTVTGAPAYRVRAVGGGTTKYQATGSDGTTVFRNLTAGTSYTFAVQVWQPADGKALSKWSKTIKAATATAGLEAPTGLAMTEQSPTTLTFTWTPPAGFDPTIHQIRLDYAEDQAMTKGNGSQYVDAAPGTLTGLSSNTNFFVRAMVVNRADHSAAGDRSTSVLGKTRSPMGWITGTVAGASDAVLGTYVAAAYSATTGDMNGQVNLVKDTSGNWTYELEVRPGAYYVHIINTGTSNYTSLWVQAGSNGAPIKTGSSQVGVAMGPKSQATQAPTVTVAAGSKLTGTIDCPGQGTKDSCSVDVTVFLSTSASETKPNPDAVVAADRSSSNGAYEIVGLVDGDYWVRTNHAEKRFKAHNDKITVAGNLTYNDSLDKANFLRTDYKVRFAKSGGVLKWSSSAALASLHPTERSDENQFRWYRNGSVVGTGSSLRASSGTIRLCVKYGRFGFNSSDWKCSAARKV